MVLKRVIHQEDITILLCTSESSPDQILLKPSLKDFEHNLASMWNRHNCIVFGTFFGISFLWDWNENCFKYCGHCWVFQICWHTECSTLTASSFRIWNSSTGIRSPPPVLFVVILPNAHLTSHSRKSGRRWVTIQRIFSITALFTS